MRFGSVALGSILAVAPALAQEPLTRPAEPDIERGARITVGDYPDGSIRLGEQGMTTVEYVVDETGGVKPGSCRVTATSRYRRLDERTCYLIETRFRFKPALRDGQPVPEVRTQSIHWRLPGEIPQHGLLDVAIRKVHAHGQCYVEQQPALAQRLVDAPLGSEEQAAVAKELKRAKVRCGYPGDELKAPPMLFAGAVAEQLVETRFANRPLVLAPDAAAPAPRNGIEALAQCVARRNPANVRALLGTTPTGPDEAVAARRIVPDLSPCVMEGTTLRFNKVSLRSLLALGLYREATTAGATAAR